MLGLGCCADAGAAATIKETTTASKPSDSFRMIFMAKTSSFR
jgi:hypothetical protein